MNAFKFSPTVLPTLRLSSNLEIDFFGGKKLRRFCQKLSVRKGLKSDEKSAHWSDKSVHRLQNLRNSERKWEGKRKLGGAKGRSQSSTYTSIWCRRESESRREKKDPEFERDSLLSQHTLDCSLTTKQFIKFHFHLSLSTFESSSLFPDSLIKNYPHFYIQFSRKILKKLAGFQINEKSLFLWTLKLLVFIWKNENS